MVRRKTRWKHKQEEFPPSASRPSQHAADGRRVEAADLQLDQRRKTDDRCMIERLLPLSLRRRDEALYGRQMNAILQV